MPTTTLSRASKAPVTIFAGGSTANLASGSNAASGSVDFSGSNPAIGGYALGYWTLSGQAGGVPSLPSGWSVYAQPASDTTPATGVKPAGPFSATILAAADDSAAFARSSPVVEAPPPVSCKVVLYNDGTGQQLNAGWSLTWTPIADQGS
ncbi:MAG: hypothetical protein U0790_00160 [Isosphaeraceae bacterium]